MGRIKNKSIADKYIISSCKVQTGKQKNVTNSYSIFKNQFDFRFIANILIFELLHGTHRNLCVVVWNEMFGTKNSFVRSKPFKTL